MQGSNTHLLCLLNCKFSSVTQLCPSLCDPMDCSMPGFPVRHQLPEPTQTRVHWVDEDIQPSYPVSSPSPPAFNFSQRHGFFQWVSSSHQVAKVLASTLVLPMNIQDIFPLGWTGWIFLQSKGFSSQYHMISHMWNLKYDINELIEKLTDIENRLVIAKRGGGWGRDGVGGWC